MTIEMREVRFDSPTAIDGYGPGGFRVGGEWMDGAIFVTPTGLIGWPVSGTPGIADVESIGAYLEGLDVVLMGLGAEAFGIDGAVHRFFDDRTVGIEPMATPAACRTYNVLLNEGRRVGAALLPIGHAFLEA